MLETNVLGLMRMTRLVLPHMEAAARTRREPRLVGRPGGLPYGGMYVGSKYAVRALTDVLARSSSGRSM